MGRTKIALALVACALAGIAAAQTSVYRWVDKDGKVHYSGEPPPADATGVTQKRVSGGGGAVDESQLPYATREAMRRNPVTLYVGGKCGDLCTDGRKLLDGRGIPYTERNAETNPADAEKLRQIAGGQLEVPLLVVGERSVKGFEQGVWNSALDGAGYPRTRLPGQVAPRKQPAESPAEPADASAAPK